MSKGMHTLVANGEPVVYGSPRTEAYQDLIRNVTGDYPRRDDFNEQTAALISQSYKDKNRCSERLPLNISASRFSFAATECCAEDARDEKYDSKYSVPLLKKDRWGNTRHGEQQIRGCRCSKCTDGRAFSSAWQFLHEVQGVKFEI